MAVRSKALREQRAQIMTEAQAFIAGDNPTAEQNAQFDAAMVRADEMLVQIERVERAEAAERELVASVASAPSPQIDPLASADPIEQVAREKRIMTAMIRGGMAAVAEEDRAMAARFVNTAMGTGGTPGTYLIAPLFQRELLIAMKLQGGMRAVSRQITTDTGASLPWPTMDDTGQSASIISENTQVTEDTELTFSNVTVGAFTYKSGVLLISLQLLQDSAFDFDTIIKDALASRFVRGQNPHFTTGSGGGTQPNGVVTAAGLGTTGTAGQTLSVIYDDMVNLEHSVDPVYRPGSAWMMHDSSKKVLRKLKDSQGHPLWQPSLTAGAPDTFNNYPVVINQDVAVMAANAKSILFGNFNNYLIRDTLGMQYLVLRERYADYLQVGYIAFCRSDGQLISAASPIKYYKNSAT